MLARLSVMFIMLPHVPHLRELTALTPPLMRWASLVAHVEPGNIDAVPPDVRGIPAVDALLGELRATADETEIERLREEDEVTRAKLAMEDAVDEAKAEGKAEGKVEGKAEGKAEGIAEGKAEGKSEGMAAMLRLQGILSQADYCAKFGSAPPPTVLPYLQR